MNFCSLTVPPTFEVLVELRGDAEARRRGKKFREAEQNFAMFSFETFPFSLACSKLSRARKQLVENHHLRMIADGKNMA
jgi:hypothetical protein